MAPLTLTDDAGDPENALDQRLAQRLATLRLQQQWSLDDLAQRTGISRATLSRLERGETSPTASLLNRLCAAYGLTMSRLLADVEAAPVRHLRTAEQPVWTDDSTGFRRRMVSPPTAGFAGELIEGLLPPGASIGYDQASVPGLEQHLYLLAGRLRLTVQDQPFDLEPGDSLRFRLWGTSRFESLGAAAAVYVLAIVHPTATPGA